MLGITLALSVVWTLWLRQSGRGWRRRLLELDDASGSSPAGRGSPTTMRRLSLTLLVASPVNLLIIGLYLAKLLPGGGKRSSPGWASWPSE